MRLLLGKSATRRHRWIVIVAGAVVSLLVFALYLKTLAPTVLYYHRPGLLDAAMLQAEVYVLGIGHPSGYPTYMMLTHLFTYLPFGDPAYRVNLASAVYAAIAVGLVYAVGWRLTRRVVAAAAGALAFGLSQTFWSQAVIAEVYTLNALFIGLLVLTLLVWRDSRRARYLLLFAFLMGLSLTHHLTSGLLIPGGIVFVLLVEPGKLREAKLWLKGFALFLVGLLPLVYLPVRAMMDAPMNAMDPSTFARFVALVSGSSFLIKDPDIRANCDPSHFAVEGPSTRLHLFGETLATQFPLVLAAAGVLGLLYLLYTDRAASALLGVIFLGCFIYALANLMAGVADYYVFLIPAFLIFAAWTSVGVGFLLNKVEGWGGSPTSLGKAVLIGVSVLALAAPFIGVGGTYSMVDRSQDYEGRRIAETVARETKPDSTILHHHSSLWYMVLVERKRRDLTLIDPFCSSAVLQNDIVWPDPLNARQSAARYNTDDTTGVGSARAAAKDSAVYILGPKYNQETVDLDRFKRAGFDVVPVEGDLLYRLVPRR